MIDLRSARKRKHGLRQFKRPIGIIGIFFAALWAIVVSNFFWESIYHYFLFVCVLYILNYGISVAAQHDRLQTAGKSMPD